MKVDRFISHRGANTDFVENTLEAFQLAKHYGFKWFEIDVQMSKDGELFLFHDETPQRLALCDKFVTDMSMNELKALKLIHPTLKVSGKILTLEEYLDWTDKSGAFTNLEFKITKNCSVYKTDIVLKTLKLLAKYPKQKNKILISSFSKTVMNVLEQDKVYKKGKLFDSEDWDKDFEYIDGELYEHYIRNKYLAIIINYECLNQERVSYLRKKFDQVFVYSVHSDDEVSNLLAWEADAMFVDKKEQLSIRL